MRVQIGYLKKWIGREALLLEWILAKNSLVKLKIKFK